MAIRLPISSAPMPPANQSRQRDDQAQARTATDFDANLIGLNVSDEQFTVHFPGLSGGGASNNSPVYSGQGDQAQSARISTTVREYRQFRLAPDAAGALRAEYG
jgi:hypothetical protein